MNKKYLRFPKVLFILLYTTKVTFVFQSRSLRHIKLIHIRHSYVRQKFPLVFYLVQYTPLSDTRRCVVKDYLCVSSLVDDLGTVQREKDPVSRKTKMYTDLSSGTNQIVVPCPLKPTLDPYHRVVPPRSSLTK